MLPLPLALALALTSWQNCCCGLERVVLQICSHRDRRWIHIQTMGMREKRLEKRDFFREGVNHRGCVVGIDDGRVVGWISIFPSIHSITITTTTTATTIIVTATAVIIIITAVIITSTSIANETIASFTVVGVPRRPPSRPPPR